MKVGLINGVFDLMTEGHLRFVIEAKSALYRASDGDEQTRLIVALNDDKSARELKGEGRPIFNVNHRIDLLMSLRWIDWALVTRCEEDLRDHIRDYRPDLLIKSREYLGKRITGEKTIRELGGEVVFVDHAQSESTTDIIRRMRAASPEKPPTDESSRW